MTQTKSIAAARYNLNEHLEHLRSEAARSAQHRASVTLERHGNLTIVLMAFEADAELKEHSVPGTLGVLMLEGRIDFTANAQQIGLNPHDFVSLPAGVPHALRAPEPSAVLVSIFKEENP